MILFKGKYRSVSFSFPPSEENDSSLINSNQDRFNLIGCVQKYLKCTDIHGDDVLDHINWEIHDIWLKEFGHVHFFHVSHRVFFLKRNYVSFFRFLVDPFTLAIVNRWRKERGEREVTMAETCPSGHM